MGNPHDNALSECQLSRIQQIVDNLYSSPHEEQCRFRIFGPSKHLDFDLDPDSKPMGFWMDTLCVPVQDENRSYRVKAIRNMKTIYENAHRVIVLDSWIEQTIHHAHLSEIAARLFLSNWQHRLWTLQEGVLAQNLFFKFKDGFTTLSELSEKQLKYRENVPGIYDSMVGQTLPLVPIANLEFHVEEEIPVYEKLSLLLSQISNRMTTKLSDETICLATILELNPESLLTIHPDKSLTPQEKEEAEKRICRERMAIFLQMIKKFDQYLFFNNLPRLDIDGFHWAPRSFLGQNGAVMPEADPNNSNTYGVFSKEEGLCGMFPGMTFGLAQESEKEINVAVSRRGAWVLNMITIESVVELDFAAKYAVISALIPQREQGECTGILGEVVQEKKNYLKVRHLSLVKIVWSDKKKRDVKGCVIASGEWLNKQKWYVI
jgi:hypothetical protein